MKVIRQEIADALTAAGIKAYPSTPQAFSPPGAVVEVTNPYLSQSDVLGHMLVRYDVIVMVSSSPKWIQDVEALIPIAVQALITEGWLVENLALEEFVVQATNRVFLGARITIAADVAIKEMI